MITKTYFKQIKADLPDLVDHLEQVFFAGQRCQKCDSQQLYVSKANFKNGRGFAICVSATCETVEEIGIDREIEFCTACGQLAFVERTALIHGHERKNLKCGHSIGWGG